MSCELSGSGMNWEGVSCIGVRNELRKVCMVCGMGWKGHLRCVGWVRKVYYFIIL